MGRKLYVEVEDVSPFGEDIDERLLNDPGRDSTFIEGYSDVRRARELAVRDGEKPEPLRHRLHIARAKSLDGSRPDGRRLDHWHSRKKYRMLQWDEALELGYRVDKNPAFSKAADGTIQHGNGVVMIADAKTAATNLKRVRQEQEAQERASRDAMEAAVEKFNRATGADMESFAFSWRPAEGEEDPDEAAKKARK